MATLYQKKVNGKLRSPYWYGLYYDLSGKRISKTTKEVDKATARKVVEQWERKFGKPKKDTPHQEITEIEKRRRSHFLTHAESNHVMAMLQVVMTRRLVRESMDNKNAIQACMQEGSIGDMEKDTHHISSLVSDLEEQIKIDKIEVSLARYDEDPSFIGILTFLKYILPKAHITNMQELDDVLSALSVQVYRSLNPLDEGDDDSEEDQKTYVYLMQDTTNNYYKIGHSKNPQYREKTLQSEKPTIELLLFYAGSCEDEIRLHERFKEKRIRGEWFNINEEDIQAIKDYFEHK